MPLFTDQTGRSISLHSPPGRIISVVPSQTELLHYMGLNDEVAGITKFCIHPDHWFRTKTRVGGTKHLSIDKIRELQPDLIIANKEENVKEQVELLAADFPVWVSDVNNLDDACSMIASIGDIVQKNDPANELVQNIRSEFELLPTSDSHKRPSTRPQTSERSTSTFELPITVPRIGVSCAFSALISA